MKISRAILLVVFFWGIPLFAQFDVGIVLPFQNNSHDPQLDWIGESFVEVLSSSLASPRFIMLDRRQRRAAFDSLGMPNTSILSHATVYEVAQALDANRVIIGSYDFSKGVFHASAQVLDMDRLRLSKKFTESGPLPDLIRLQTGLAWQILHFLRPSAVVSKADFIADHPGPRLDAFENYLRGLITKNRAAKVRYFRNAMRLDPQFTKPAFELGLIYFHNHDYPTSTLWLSKLRRDDPDYLDANYFLGLAYLYQQKYERSAAALRVVAQQLPLNEVYNNLGIALLRQNKPGALGYFEKAIRSNPGDCDYQFNLGYALWKRQNYQQAVPHLRIAVQGNHVKPAWRVIYMQSLEKIGRTDEAALQEQLLEQQSPDWRRLNDPRQLQNLEQPKDNYDGASLHQLRVLIRVQTELKHAKLPLQEHVALHFQHARELLKEGYDRQAADELREVIGYDPNKVEAYLELAKIYAKEGRYQEALRVSNESLQHKKNAASHLLLAKIYMEQGRLNQAQSELNAVLRLKPSSAEATAMMEELKSKNVSRQ